MRAPKDGSELGRDLLRERSRLDCGKWLVGIAPHLKSEHGVALALRILASSAWVSKHVMMPANWRHKFPEFYGQLTAHQKKGKNKHDDGPDVLAAIYEGVANPSQFVFRVRSA